MACKRLGWDEAQFPCMVGGTYMGYVRRGCGRLQRDMEGFLVRWLGWSFVLEQSMRLCGLWCIVSWGFCWLDE